MATSNSIPPCWPPCGWLLGIALAMTAAAAGAAEGGVALPAAFANSDVAAKIHGRHGVALPIEGVSAWPDPQEGPAWYLDAGSGVAGTREGWFRLVDGRLQRLGKSEVQAFHRSIAQRLALPPKFQWAPGDARARRELVLLSAYDCGGCEWLQRELRDQAEHLDVRIHYVIGTLDRDDEESSAVVRAITCAHDPIRAYWNHDDGIQPPAPAPDCVGQGDNFGYLTTLLGARYSPWLVDKASGEVIPFGSIESGTLVDALNAPR